MEAFLESQRHLVRRALLDASPREAEARVLARANDLTLALGFVSGLGVFEPDARLESLTFLLVEESRSAALSAARVAAAARADPDVESARDQARAASVALVDAARLGVDADAARRDLDFAWRELVRRGADRLGAPAAADFEAFTRALGSDAAFVGWIQHLSVEGVDVSEPFWTAFVLRAGQDGPRLTRRALGPAAEVAELVGRWRRAVLDGRDRGLAAPQGDDLTAAGDALRARIFDPPLADLRGVGRLVVALDDVLHDVPLDALPAGPFSPEPAKLVGDVLRIELRSSVYEVLAPQPQRPAQGALVLLGHPAFDSAPLPAATTLERPELAAVPARAAADAGILRGGAWERGFPPLPATGEEVRAIAEHHEEAFGPGATRHVLVRRAASREALESLAPGARFLHIATHGWFAPDSIASSADGARPEAVGFDEGARGSSPMVLTGLALAGGNLPADAHGHIPGLLTAQEIATLDLGACELAVLSA